MDPAARRELETIKQAILDTVRANGIYLFGSYASGTPDKDSDFDVYVVIPDDSMRPIEARQKIGSTCINIRSLDTPSALQGYSSALLSFLQGISSRFRVHTPST